MTELTIPIYFSDGNTSYRWTTDTAIIDEDGVGHLSARSIRLIVGSLAEVGIITARPDDGGYDSELPAGMLVEAVRLIRAVVHLDALLPRE